MASGAPGTGVAEAAPGEAPEPSLAGPQTIVRQTIEPPAMEPPAAAPQAIEPHPAAPQRAIEDLIPEDVESSFGGATGDLWSDSAESLFDQDEVAAVAPVEEQPDTEAPARARPERHAPPGRSGDRQRGRGQARATTASPTHVASDTVEGRAFARLQELFPGRVLEVNPLKPVAPAAGEQAEEAAGTTEEFGAGYDGGEEPDPPGSDE